MVCSLVGARHSLRDQIIDSFIRRFFLCQLGLECLVELLNGPDDDGQLCSNEEIETRNFYSQPWLIRR